MRWLLAALVLLVALSAMAQQRVVLVGDSLSTDTAGTRYEAGHYLGAHYRVKVLGVGATSSGDGTARVSRRR